MISDALLAQLEQVPLSRDAVIAYRPCRVRLRSGEWIDRVYIQDAIEYIVAWGVWPWEDHAKKSVPFDDVVEIESSPTRLPPDIAEKLYASGETGMGYYRFALVFTDGAAIDFMTGDAVDWVDLPGDRRAVDVVDVIPNGGGGTNGYRSGANFSFCLYRSRKS